MILALGSPYRRALGCKDSVICGVAAALGLARFLSTLASKGLRCSVDHLAALASPGGESLKSGLTHGLDASDTPSGMPEGKGAAQGRKRMDVLSTGRVRVQAADVSGLRAVGATARFGVLHSQNIRKRLCNVKPCFAGAQEEQGPA